MDDDGMEVRAAGPVFDGRALAALHDYVEDAAEQVADVVLDQVLGILGQELRDPTGYYESRVQVERQQGDRAVTDSGVIYGPWLEGTGSRNSGSTFKGYQAFRRATQEADQLAGPVAERTLKPYLRRMR